MAYDTRALVGVGGWLAFFVISLGLFTPLKMAVEVAAMLGTADQWTANLGPLGRPVMIFELAIMAISTCGYIFLAWRLMATETWQTVRMTIAGLWILGPALNLLDFLVVLAATGLGLAQLFDATAVPIGQSLFHATLWTAYLLRSERVANTYLRNNDEAELAAVFD
jgi:hypothetical protein